MPRTTTPHDFLHMIEQHVGILRRELATAPDLRRSILARRSVVAIRDAAKAVWTGDEPRREKAPGEMTGRPVESTDVQPKCQACRQRRDRLRRKARREAANLEAERRRTRQLAMDRQKVPAWSVGRWHEFLAGLQGAGARVEALMLAVDNPRLAVPGSVTRWRQTHERLVVATRRAIELCETEHPDLVISLEEIESPEPPASRAEASAEAAAIVEGLESLGEEAANVANRPKRGLLEATIRQAGLARFWQVGAKASRTRETAVRP